MQLVKNRAGIQIYVGLTIKPMAFKLYIFTESKSTETAVTANV